MEQSAAEMAQHLVELAAPVKSFLDDEEIHEAWEECTKKAVRNKLDSILTVYADMAPLIFGEKHLRDVLQILAAIEGKPVADMLQMNGAELMKDTMLAWEEQIKPFFTLLGISASGM